LAVVAVATSGPKHFLGEQPQRETLGHVESPGFDPTTLYKRTNPRQSWRSSEYLLTLRDLNDAAKVVTSYEILLVVET
jgi:hypothetical protein